MAPKYGVWTQLTWRRAQKCSLPLSSIILEAARNLTTPGALITRSGQPSARQTVVLY